MDPDQNRVRAIRGGPGYGQGEAVLAHLELLLHAGQEGEFRRGLRADRAPLPIGRSEEHTSELQSLMRISYAVFCLKKKNKLKKSDQYCKNKINMTSSPQQAPIY